MGWGIDETDTWPSVRPTANGMAQAPAAPFPMIATSMPGRTWAQRGLPVRMMISTRRFFCRPAAVSLGATGIEKPLPEDVMEDSGIP